MDRENIWALTSAASCSVVLSGALTSCDTEMPALVLLAVNLQWHHRAQCPGGYTPCDASDKAASYFLPSHTTRLTFRCQRSPGSLVFVWFWDCSLSSTSLKNLFLYAGQDVSCRLLLINAVITMTHTHTPAQWVCRCSQFRDEHRGEGDLYLYPVILISSLRTERSFCSASLADVIYTRRVRKRRAGWRAAATSEWWQMDRGSTDERFVNPLWGNATAVR